jgi:hydroxypyruvate reductase
VRAALQAVDAGALVRRALHQPEVVRAVESAAAIDVVAVGKAALPMLLAAREACRDAPLRHVIGIANQPIDMLPTGVIWHVAPHPVPDRRSVAAADAIMDVARAATSRDLLMVLMSGGASAMMARPAAGLSLEDKRLTSLRLLQHGAEVHHLNTVRRHLSAIKGGQLAAATAAEVLTLAISDVVGDEPTAIGSGPTVADPTTFADALDVLERYGGISRYPDAVVTRLRDGASGIIPETPKPGDARLARATVHVIGRSRVAVDGARAAAASLGYVVQVKDEPVVGTARDAGEALVESASQQAAASAPRLCMLSSGETTVRVVGSGRGGRTPSSPLRPPDRSRTRWRRGRPPASAAA